MSKRDEAARIVALFRERSAFWAGQGFQGAALYQRLAADPELPENLHPAVLAELEGIRADGIAQRRKRGGGPSFLRTASNVVVYPTAAYCSFLAARFVERKSPLAAREYTRALDSSERT